MRTLDFKWPILIGEMLVPFLHFMTIAAFLLLAGIAISTTYITIPALLQPINNSIHKGSNNEIRIGNNGINNNDDSSNNDDPNTTLKQLQSVINNLSSLTFPVERALFVTLTVVSTFGMRHSTAEVHWRWPYHITCDVIFLLMVGYHLIFLFPLEERISSMDPEGLTPWSERYGRGLEVERLVREWGKHRRRRTVFPLVMGLISLWSFMMT